MNYETAFEVEIALSRYFDRRQYILVPNLSWSLLPWECDLALITKSDYLYEIEIKISKADLKRDLKKRKWLLYDRGKVKRTWFAYPEVMSDNSELVPEIAGILIVDKHGFVKQTKPPHDNPMAKKLNPHDKNTIMRLLNFRLWNMKDQSFTRFQLQEKSK